MKKRKKKDVKINITPFHCKIRRYEGGFTWSFYAPIKGDYGHKKIINIKFERWWLNCLANDLKTVISEEREELNRLIDMVGFKDGEL